MFLPTDEYAVKIFDKGVTIAQIFLVLCGTARLLLALREYNTDKAKAFSIQGVRGGGRTANAAFESAFESAGHHQGSRGRMCFGEQVKTTLRGARRV